MSTPLVPGPNPVLKMSTIGIFLSAIIYGLAFSLYIQCFQAITQQGRQKTYSKRKERILLSYITLMILFSTLALLQSIYFVAEMTFQNVENIHENFLLRPISKDETKEVPWLLPFTIWGADGFMIWRCLILYEGLSSKTIRRTLYTLLVLMGVFTMAIGFMIFASSLLQKTGFLLILISMSTFANLVFACLIAMRIIYYTKAIKRITDVTPCNKLYNRIIAMCIESCALIVVAGIIYVIVFPITCPGSLVPLAVLPHISVISPLLIIYRVAHARENMKEFHPSEIVIREIDLEENLDDNLDDNGSNTLPS